jgi:hypothetical protein
MLFSASIPWSCSKSNSVILNELCTDKCSIDLLSSKLKFSAGSQDYPSSRDRYHQNSHQHHFTSTQKDDFGQSRSEHVVGVNGGKSKTRSDSTDQIIECGSSQGDGSIKLDDMDLKGNVIKKTVEFRVV